MGADVACTVAPAFEAGLHHEFGSVGMWLLDRRDVLRRGDGSVGGHPVTWRARRQGGVLAVTYRRRHPDGTPIGEPVRVGAQRLLVVLARAGALVGALDMPGSRHLASPPSSGDLCDLLSDPVVAEDLRAALAAVRPFVDALDPRAVGLAVRGAVPRDDLDCYARLDRQLNRDGRIARALDLMPGLEGTVCRAARHWGPFSVAVSGGVDALARHLAHSIRTDGRGPAVIAAARTTGRRVAALDEGHRAEMARVLSGMGREGDAAVVLGPVLAALPPDWTPRTGPEWVALTRCAPVLDEALRRAPGCCATLLDARGDWIGFLDRLSAAHRRADGDLVMATLGVNDLVRAWCAQVLRPALALGGAAAVTFPVIDVARRLLLDGRRICRQLDTSRRWHGAQHRLRASLPRPGGHPIRWRRGWPTTTLHGVTFTELTDADALADEGAPGTDASGHAGLSHCVGGYAEGCLSGRSRVVSLRAADGSRLSTAELTWQGGRPGVRQHAGANNARPPRRAEDALRAYVRAVGAGDLTVDEAALAPVRFDSEVLRAIAAAGYDATAPGAWEAVRDLWDPFVPRRLRGMGQAELSRLAVAQSMHPELTLWSSEFDPFPGGDLRLRRHVGADGCGLDHPAPIR